MDDQGKKHFERERHENEAFLSCPESVIAFPDKPKDKAKKIEKFLKKEQADKETGEVLKTSTVLSPDMDKIKEYLDLMGYYTIMTSEINLSDREIISKYHGLSRIENSFRITKHDSLTKAPRFITPSVPFAERRIIKMKTNYQGEYIFPTDKSRYTRYNKSR